MTVPLGEYDSPGADRRRSRFEEQFKKFLDVSQPRAMAQASNVFGLSTSQQSPALAAQQAAFGAGTTQASRPAFNLQRPQLGPSPTPLSGFPMMQQPGPLRPPAMIARPGDPGPFPFQGGRNPLELLSAAGSFIGNLPVPGGPITLAPSARGGRPGATLSVPQQQTVGQVAEFERRVFQPVTQPAGRFVAEQAVRQQPGLRIADVATGGRVSEIAGDVGATVAGELLLPSNLIPIPIVDLALARLLGITAKAGARVTRSVLQRLSREAGEIAVREGDTALGTAARRFQDDAARLVQERPVVGGAGEPPRGAQPAPGFEPEPIRPPAGQETPLFPELEVETALKADLERAFSGAPEFADAPGVGGRDFVGEQLTKDVLPTSTDVQRWSQRISPEERAAAAGEVADVRRGIEDFDVVIERNSDRYRQNWFTKLDDWLQPKLGRNRELQTSVRNIFVDRDTYIAQQGSRMRLAAREWIGRHRETLGLVTGELDPLLGRLTGQQRRGYALKVQIREGAKIPTKARQHLNDIIEHPDDYILTPQQQTAIDEYNDIFANMVRIEQRHGVDVNELWNSYAPRLITKTPKGQEFEAAISQLRTRFPSTHPWYTRERAMPDVRQLFAAGYELGDPLAAMEVRLVSGAETIANQRSVRALQGLGELPSARVPETTRVALREATDAHSIARKQALKTGSTSDRAVADQAAVALDQAKREMRVEATLAREQRPQVLGRTVKPDVALEVSKFIKDESPGVVDDIFRVMRTSLINADYGSLMLQNWTTFWRNNPAWLKAAALGARSISDAPYDYIVRNADVIDMGLRYGAIAQPEEFLLRRGGNMSQILGQAPIVRESQNIFEWNVFVAQTERWKGVMRLAKTEDELLDLATVLRKQSGSNFMPGLTRKQAALMSRLFFAPQFTTAITSSVIDPLRPGLSGVARRESIKTMGMLLAGTASLTVAMNMKFTGSPGNLTDPDKPGFWGIRVGKGFVFPFGPFQPLVVALARTAKGDPQAWPRFLTNKASMPVRWAQRLAEAMGLSPEGLVGPSFSRPEVVRPGESPIEGIRRELGELAPIGPSQAIEGIRRGAPITGLEIAGGRTSVVSAFTERIEARQEVMRERGIAGNFDDLDDIVKAEINADPRVQATQVEIDKRPARDRVGEGFDVAEGLRTQQQAEQEQDDALLEAGTLPGDRWVRNHSDRERLLFSNRELIFDVFGISFEKEEERGRVNEAIDAYFAVDLEDFIDTQTGEVDFFGFRQTQKATLEPLTPQQRLDFDNLILGKNDTAMEKRFRDARRVLDAAPVPFQFTTPEQYNELLSFYRELTKFRDAAVLNIGRSIPVEQAIRDLGIQLGKSPNFVQFAISAHGGRSRDALRNPAYDTYLLQHHQKSELGLFFPGLYRRDDLQKKLFGLRQFAPVR